MIEEQRKQILVECVKRFARNEWFRDAVVWDRHPTDDAPTLEIKVNYLPLFERKVVMDFAQSVGLKEKFTVVDRDGNKQE
jgi:hypothetical protein